MKTSRKIFAITYLISVVAIVGVAAFTVSRTNDTLHDLARQRLHESVSREARGIYTSLDMVRSDVLALAEEASTGGAASEALDGPTRERLAERFSLLLQKRPAYTRVVLQTGMAGEPAQVSVEQSDERLRAKGVGAAIGSDLAAMAEEARQLWPGNVTLSPVRLRASQTAGDAMARVLYASTPIATRDGRVTGALVVAIDFEVLVSGFGRPRTDVTLFIADRDGTYLYRPGQPADPVQNAVATYRLEDRWATWTQGSDPQLHLDQSGRGVALVLYRVLLAGPVIGPGASWLVVGGEAPLETLDRAITTFRTELALFALLAAGLVALALALATTALTRPITALTAVADRISAGESDIDLPAGNRADEFGRLSRAMARMLEALRDSAKNEEQAAMGRMATMIAHDLRNALSSVKMNL
ncbi:MAG: HAMP domain-containing protein, partial [Actinomycetota bacterium]